MASYKDYKSVSAAQKAGSLYFVGKDGKKKLAVTKEQLDAWKKRNKGKYKGSALTAYANAKGKDVGGSSKRDSSPKPKLRPGSESAGAGYGVMTKAEKDEVDRANKTMSTREVKDLANSALTRAEATEITASQNKRISQEKRGSSPGEKFNAWYKENGSRYDTMKEAKEAYDRTLRSGNYKGGMQKKKGYSSGGLNTRRRTGHNDYRKGGMFT
jgi:hypothetical protein